MTPTMLFGDCLRQQQRGITISAAKELLGFPPHHRPTMRELRSAYFEAAKQTHPDLVAAKTSSTTEVGTDQKNDDNNNDNTNNDSMMNTKKQYRHKGIDFIQVTVAYERLLDSKEFDHDETWKISQEEEDEYRRACEAVLGIPAEIVEESKKNPMFRHWLDGNTDGAQHWRAFFSNHGGLAQKLHIPIAYIESRHHQEDLMIRFESRPKRKRR